VKNDEQVIGVLREKNYQFRTLEKIHVQLEESLDGMNKRKALSPKEELEKKTFQKEKLAAKDTMEKMIRHFVATGESDFKIG